MKNKKLAGLGLALLLATVSATPAFANQYAQPEGYQLVWDGNGSVWGPSAPPQLNDGDACLWCGVW